MKKIIHLILIMLSMLVVSSCTNEENIDTEKPTIAISSPTDHQEIQPGAILNFKAMLKDNIGLKSYKIEVHSDDDGHEHKSKDVAIVLDYHFIGEVPNNEKQFELLHDIQIPVNVVPQHYHVGITVLDVNGNQNQQFVEVFIGVEDLH